ncbi:hypothetical protein XBFFL1_1160027 [Xenorhabdus bovienii str. feltiae Florida]|nr:hypothetical protein XBFFR1_1760009 [Xenorhabdus bovienii str. feltiae France]CDG90890.1 hypothetical protein XBFFL1_1160027 [Xenorhabdus bovienii str. feltiae Florida]
MPFRSHKCKQFVIKHCVVCIFQLIIRFSFFHFPIPGKQTQKQQAH